jgi:nucleoside-diphosphate-sugar epimerase
MPRLSLQTNFPVFVTGASGFIGGKLAERLLAEGRRVRVLSRRPLSELEARGAEVVPGDLHDAHAFARGCRSADTVFHVAGRVGVWGPAKEFFRVNVEGTRLLLAAAQEAKVPRFVYTSSPSVVFNGGDLADVDESAPLCTAAPCAYPTSKAQAERLVLEANCPDFRTLALRPHLVWGPGDRNVVPRVMALARSGRLKIVGSGRNKVDITHIANVIDAHLLAEGALAQSGHPSGGKAYFISNGEPVSLWDWINQLLRGVGLPEVQRRVPVPVAYATGGLLEALWTVLPLKGEPPMTRFLAEQLSTTHWYDMAPARRDFGYVPQVSIGEGLARLAAAYRG